MFTLDLDINGMLKKTRDDTSKQLSILIIDDNADFADMFTMILKHLGYKAYQAYNGHDGLNMAQAGDPNVIFFDICLPDMTGAEAARCLRINAKLDDVLIVALSESYDLNNLTEIESFFDLYALKPIRTSFICEILKTAQARLMTTCHIPYRYVSAHHS